MVTLTPELAGNSMVITLGAMAISFVITLYSLWLNWKQSKVKDQMKEQIEILKEIRDKL